MTVIETFFAVDVANMERATAFYVTALGATVTFASPGWSSLRIAGVRVALALNPMHKGGRSGLHFTVSDLAASRSHVDGAGGRTGEAVEVAPGVIVAEATDTEGNAFTVTPRGGSTP
jgi:predicted enzyme related to lactoylglutathione lyase